MRYILFLIPTCTQKTSGSHLHLLIASALLPFPLLQGSCHRFQLSSSAPQQPPLLLFAGEIFQEPRQYPQLAKNSSIPAGSPQPPASAPVGIHGRRGALWHTDALTHLWDQPCLHTLLLGAQKLSNSFALYLDFSPQSDAETSAGPCVQLPSVQGENLPEFCVFGIVVLRPCGTKVMDWPWRG